MLLTRPAAPRTAPRLPFPRAAAATAARRLATGRLLAVGAVVAAAALASYLAAVFCHPHGLVLTWFDLHVYQAAGTVAWRAPATLDSWQLQPGNQFTYTPFAAMLFAGTRWLPPGVLGWLMTSAGLAALGLTGWVTLGALGWRGHRRAGLALALCGAALWTEPVARTLRLGQVELLLMAIVVWDLCRPGTRRWRGVGVGVAAAVKLVPLIFIPYLLLTRRFRAAMVACGTFAALGAAGLLVLPQASLQWWFGPDFLQATRTGFIGFVANQSLRGLATRDAGSVTAATWWWLGTAVVTAAAGLLAAACLDLAGRPVHGWVTCALTGLLVSPVSWDHHWVWLVPGLAVLADTAIRARAAARAGLWAAAAALTGLFGAWPSLWEPGSPLVPWGLIWYADADPGGVGAAGASEYHWRGLGWLAGNLYVLAGLACLAALVVLARCSPTTYEGSLADSTPARSTPTLAASPPPTRSAALTTRAVRLRRASRAAAPPPRVMARAPRSSRPLSPRR
jgi:alpha-1,2-mannosyltransferase